MTTQPLLHVDHISHEYPNATQTLDDVSFTLNEGETVSLIGPSGCGKSTLLRILLGFEHPSAGKIIVRDDAPAHPFAYHPQRDELFEWRSVVENAALGCEIAGEKKKTARQHVRGMLAEFGLDGFGDYRPSQLSGGMRQRTALLRTVAQRRPILLLDEPFSALDAITRKELNLWLKEAAARHGWTILLVTHDVNEAHLISHRIINLSNRPAHVVSIDNVEQIAVNDK